MTCAHAVPGAGFKRCCLHTGKYDGGNRNYFFPESRFAVAGEAKRKRRKTIDFRFLFAYSAGR